MKTWGFGFSGSAEPAVTGKSGRRVALLLALGIFALLCTRPPPAEAATKRTQRTAKSSDSSTRMYRWVDEDGVTHYGDQVPPEYAPTDRQVLNQYGIPVKTEQGAMTQAELAAEERAEADREAALAAARRDEVLLSTYLSIEEIEALRNRRVELMEGQISVTKNYLTTLNEKLQRLQIEASTYKPYSSDPAAEPIDAKLAQELSDTLDSIALYEKTLQDTRTRQVRIVAEFDADIARFKQLKGM